MRLFSKFPGGTKNPPDKSGGVSVGANLNEANLKGAHLSKADLGIADLTAHKSIAQELQAIVPSIPVPVQPLLDGSRRLNSIFPEFKKYPWVLPGYRYGNMTDLLASLEEKIIRPAEEKAKELASEKIKS